MALTLPVALPAGRGAAAGNSKNIGCADPAAGHTAFADALLTLPGGGVAELDMFSAVDLVRAYGVRTDIVCSLKCYRGLVWGREWFYTCSQFSFGSLLVLFCRAKLIARDLRCCVVEVTFLSLLTMQAGRGSFSAQSRLKQNTSS